ncbi:MAG: DUF5809 family protein [Halorhabdus sp.]
MHTQGVFEPETVEAARERYAALQSAADVVVREVARAMDFDGDAYDRYVSDEVFETAHDAMFASLLSVTVGTDEEFEAFSADRDAEVVLTGSENVDNAAWHAPPFADRIVATTFQDAEDAAVATLRRQAFGRVYRGVLKDDEPETVEEH